MKLTVLMLTLNLIQVTATVYSQNNSFTLSKAKILFKDAIKEIENQTDYRFAYSVDYVDNKKLIEVANEKISVNEFLNFVEQEMELNYLILEGNLIVITAKDDKILNQDYTIKGKVTDLDGNPLPGVNIVEKGTTNGSVTNLDGEYSISVSSPDATLSFSYVGFLTEDIEIAGKTTVDIILVEDIQSLEEVVVVGYGTQKKRDVIGSIASVKSDVIESSTGVSNFTSLLQGQAAGASVQTSSGRLGASVDVKIRGLSSISAGTSPLWIIDGVPIITSANTGAEYTSEQSPMSLINQADIESIEILKDAAATSIYGSRGSNGVIIVTTKSGKTGRTNINFNFSTGMSDLPFQQVEFVNTKQWFEMKDEMKASYGLRKFDLDEDYFGSSIYVTETLTREQAENINIDWLKEGLRKGNFQSYNLSVVGGNEKATYFLSTNYRKDKGVILNDDLERYGLRANVDIKPSKYFKTGAKFNFSLSNSSRGKNFYRVDDGNQTGSAGGFSFLMYKTLPFLPVYSLVNPKEYFNPYLGNPVALSDPDYMVQDVEMYRGLANIYGEYSFPFLTDLAIRSELSVDLIQANRNTWISDKIRWEGTAAQDAARTSRTFNYNAFLKYDKILASHSFNAIAGVEAQRSLSWFRSMEGRDLVGSYKELGSPNQLVSMYSGLDNENYLLAYFGRANYKYKDRYLAGISIRRDASSVFTSEYRWGTFVALSAGWILSDEPFMGNFGNKNFLKLRGSFGQTGNANIPTGLDASKYSSGLAYGSQDIIATNGTSVSSIGVSNLTWETTNNSDIGLDFGFNNNKINGSLAYYNKYVKDLLLATELPYSSGISSIYGNIGDLVNSGIEFNISSINIESKNFKWQTTFNFSYNHNEVKKLVPRVDEAGTGMISDVYITKVGYPVRDYYLTDFAYVDTETGLSMIYAVDNDYYDETGETRRLKDENGEDVVLIGSNSNAAANRFHIKDKNQIPKYYGGITNSFKYKNFDFSLLITYSGGNYILDQFYRDLIFNYSGNNNQIPLDLYQNYWKEPGDVAKYQRLNWKGNLIMEDGTVIGLGDQRINSDQILYKGDYTKLKSITLGYTIPKSSSRVGKLFENIRLYATFDNLYTLTKYPGWDPEGQGTVSQWDLPQLFSATFGASVKF